MSQMHVRISKIYVWILLFLHFSWFRVGGLVQTGSCAVGPLSVVSRNSGSPQSFTAAAAPILIQLGMLGEPE